ncbi:MAG: hypothetical protein LOX98_07300 [Lysobacter sp.]|uniref:Lipoprotein n=2 Tax=Lysobacteraceae TaxID=32033 RepID=A0ABN7QUP3_9GAMM|nr:hypothetical protein [Lysobacter luteus]MDV3255221.1 hypothetical protein [Lysobacter sp.]MDV5981215.1 hypothetical protein [Lysobacter sp.]CAG4967713.1 hypothetical protein LYB30171_00102 [Lysobacter luteus]
MIRKLLLPAVAIALLGGCMTGGYSYRQDRGDYYYGNPGTDYRYYDPYGRYSDRYYGSGYYGSGYYSRYYGHPGYYRYPYGYHRYPNGYYRPPVVVRPRPDDGHDGGGHHRDDDRTAPSRNLDRLQRERINRTPTPIVQQQRRPQPAAVARPAPTPAARERGGSRMEQVMRRARSGAVERSREVEP